MKAPILILKASSKSYLLLSSFSSVTKFTREAGVRSLERQIGAICRAVALKQVEDAADQLITEEKASTFCLGESHIIDILGVSRRREYCVMNKAAIFLTLDSQI